MLSFAAAAIGGIASVDSAEFYADLSRPGWAPPGWVFGPVWTVLYALMGIGAWLVWRERGWRGAGGALGLFVAQLALNAGWPWIFFAWHRGAFAFGEILLLFIAIVGTVAAFWRIRPLAGWLLLPYLAWVGFATALTYATWQRNPHLLG
jgi:tryptophan-rich sensory protein